MQYKITYRDGKAEFIEAASYTVARGTAIFRKEDGGHAAIVSFSEVRSIVEVADSEAKEPGAFSVSIGGFA